MTTVTPISRDTWRPNPPHVITKGVGRNRRWRIRIAARGPAADDVYSIAGPDVLDVAGEITSAGRTRITQMLSATARRSKALYCIVWSERDCTWLESDGTARQGHRPPTGEPVDPSEYRHVPAGTENLWYMELPEGSLATHICIHRIARDYVEVGPGAPVILGHFDDPILEGDPDPAEDMLDRDGIVRAPASFRGQAVSSFDGATLFGPIHPSGAGTVMRHPSPDDLRRACESVAGRSLPDHMIDAAWRVCDPEDRSMNDTGVLKAA